MERGDRRLFPEFMAFYFPDAASQIDWHGPVKFLDKEFQQIVREAEHGRVYVDKLVSVKRLNGDEGWIYIHCEVQSQPDLGFPERMFTYYYRIYDRFHRPVASLAVLADNDPDWKPDSFTTKLFGCRVSLEFPTVKLLDYMGRLEKIVALENPFALVTAAHLLTQQTVKDEQSRYQARFRLTKLLLQRQWERPKILGLLAIVEWMMHLSPELEDRLYKEIKQVEEEKKMKFMTYPERKGFDKGIEKGTQEGLEKGLEKGIEKGIEKGGHDGKVELLSHVLIHRFGALPEGVVEKLQAASSEQILDWTDAALDADSLQEIF